MRLSVLESLTVSDRVFEGCCDGDIVTLSTDTDTDFDGDATDDADTLALFCEIEIDGVPR